MGNVCCAEGEDLGNRPHDSVITRKPSKIPNEIVRLFLIGSGEVGKSTLIKQMQKLCEIKSKDYAMHDEEWQPINEPLSGRAEWTRVVHQNILKAIAVLVQKATAFGHEYKDDDLIRCADDVLDACEHDVTTLHHRNIHISADLADKIARLWMDENGPVRRAYHRRKEFNLSDSAEYFLNPDKLREISSVGYVPSADDIIRARDPTTGMRDYNFTLRDMKLSIRDMGGQPVERAHIPAFLNSWLQNGRPGDRNFILYMAALSDYNKKNPRHPSYTQLDESLMLLKVLLNMPQLERCGFILFLNKRDIFERKLGEDDDFQTYFKKFLGNDDGKKDKTKKQKSKNLAVGGMEKNRSSSSLTNISLEQAEKVVASRFAEIVSETTRQNDTLYCRFTCAVDTQAMEAIFGAVRNDIINDLLRQGTWVPFP